MSEGGNAYEAARALRIARNRARMMELGLVQAAQALSGPACWPPLRQHRRGGKPVSFLQILVAIFTLCLHPYSIS